MIPHWSTPRWPRRVRGRFAAAPLLGMLAMLLCASPVSAQESATLRLLVVDAERREAVEGAVITVEEENLSALTDGAGRATLTRLPLRSLRISVRRIGYQTEQLRFDPVAGQVREATVELRVAPVEIAGVEGTAERRNRYLDSQGFYDRRRVGLGRYLEREHFERLSQTGTRMTEGLVGMGGGFAIRRAGRKNYVVSSRGGCPSQVFIDGSPVPPEYETSGRRTPPDIDALLSPHQIEAVEWYSGVGSVPSRFMSSGFGPSNPACGVLLIWTRRGP
jgi:hypothetical protein